MSTDRFLVMGDNHGDVESIKAVVDGTEGEESISSFTQAISPTRIGRTSR